MKLLYCTDLHGRPHLYEACLAAAQTFTVDAVVNGGDMLPTQGDLFEQDGFIRDFLESHFEQYSQVGIPYLCCLGNDDLRIWDSLFEETCSKYPGIHNLAQRKIRLGEYEFIGMNWITDPPFGLKDRCRMDNESFVFPPQYGPAVLSQTGGWEELSDWFAYARTLPTLAAELKELPPALDASRSIYVIHMPPQGLDLDVCQNGERVGSQAVYDFLKTVQPRLSLHGHIHESPQKTGYWQADLGKTLCIQPGQTEDGIFVLIDLETLDTACHNVGIKSTS